MQKGCEERNAEHQRGWQLHCKTQSPAICGSASSKAEPCIEVIRRLIEVSEAQFEREVEFGAQELSRI